MARPAREVGYEELLVAIARLKLSKPEDVEFLNSLEQQILGRLTQAGATPASPAAPAVPAGPTPPAAPGAGAEGYTPPASPVPGVFAGGGSPEELRRIMAGR